MGPGTADMLLGAEAELEEAAVGDLGCGTGVLGIGGALLGAALGLRQGDGIRCDGTETEGAWWEWSWMRLRLAQPRPTWRRLKSARSSPFFR